LQLGIFGFLASSTLMADGTANAGLLDQRAAFEWVQRWISKFGGNPQMVTISVSRGQDRHNMLLLTLAALIVG
jgi:carboxylesterase type B